MRIFFVFILSITLGLHAGLLFGQGSDVVYLPQGYGTGTDTWNPYPGQSTNGGQTCVRPRSNYADSPTALPQVLPTTTLYPEDYEEEIHDMYVSPTRSGGELYLARVPYNKRESAFQRLNVNALWVPSSGGSKGLGMTQLDLSAMFAFPLPSADAPFMVTPSYEAWFFEPKTKGTVPRRTLHTVGVDFRWIAPIVRNKFSIDLGASVLYSGDFKVKGSKAMRYPAHIAALWNVNPRLRFVIGALYLDRNDDYNWLPMAGLVWTPNEDVSVELVTPRLRIAQRVRWFGSAAGNDKSDWLYAAFEVGGGSWAYEFADDAHTHIDYRDFRAALGYERRCASGITIGFEVGYMFHRRMEYDLFGVRLEPSDNVFLRIRTSF